jgi:xanthosine utilization system XapX-like protein
MRAASEGPLFGFSFRMIRMRHPILPRTALVSLLGAMVLTLAPLAQARTQPATAAAEHRRRRTATPATRQQACRPAHRRQAHGQQHQVAQAHVHKSGVKASHASGHSHVPRRAAPPRPTARRHPGREQVLGQGIGPHMAAHSAPHSVAHSGSAHRATAQKAGTQHLAHAGKASTARRLAPPGSTTPRA